MKKLYSTLCFLLALSSLSLLPAQKDCMILEARHMLANSGSDITVDIAAKQFKDMIGMQFSLRWDTSVILLEEVTNLNLPNLSSSNFGLPEVTGYPGRLSFFWTLEGINAVTLPQDQAIFSLVFKVTGAPGQRSRIDFDEFPTALEFISGDPVNFGPQPASLLSGSVTVGSDPPDSPKIAATNCPQVNSCSEVPPLGIETETSGGALPYTYEWAGPQGFEASGPHLSEITPGAYRVIVTDAAGLTNSALFYAPGILPIQLDDITIIPVDDCDQQSGGGIDYSVRDGSGSYEYRWSDGADTKTRTDLAAGIYSLTVTDLFLGCSISHSFIVPATSNFRVGLSDTRDVSCGTTQTGAISLILEGNIEGATVAWNTGATGASIDNLPTGAYTATITDASGCTIEWSGAVEASDQLEIDGIIGYTDCNENSGYILMEVPGDPADFTYAWSTGATTKDISGLSFGAYRVTVTNTTTGCSGFHNFPVKDAEFLTGSIFECITVDDQTVFAKVSTVVWGGGDPPYTFNWNNGDSMTTELVASTTVSLPTTLTVTITDSKGCVTVADPVTPDCVTGSSGSDFHTASTYACLDGENGQSSQARIKYFVWEGGTPPYTFTWSTGEIQTHPSQSEIIAPADAATSYTVTVTDQLGNTHVSAPVTPICHIDGGPLFLEIGQQYGEAGEAICVPVRVEGFNDIAGLQFSISWDPAQLTGDSLINPNLPDFSTSNYSFGPFSNYPNDGTMTFSWIHSQGLGYDLPDGSALFEICFTAIGDQDSVGIVLSNHPTIIEATTGALQVVPVITKDGFVLIGGGAVPKVWPGDTDDNGLVDHFDLLNIGLGFQTQGYPRPQPSLGWQAQFAAPWPQYTPNTQINYRHIDTDGNGTINATDTLALALNYGLVNEFWDGEDGFSTRENLPDAARTAGAPIYVDTYSVQEGSSPVFDIMLGDEDQLESTAYGVAFSIDYDPLAIVPGSIYLSFEDSWLGQQGQDLLTFYRIDPENHLVHVAMTRTDGHDISGKGPIAQLLITIEDVIFRSDNYEIPISIKNARLINASEEAVPVEERSTTITIGTSRAIDPALDRHIRVYPVPAEDLLFLRTPNLKVEAVELYSPDGKTVRNWPGDHQQLELNELTQGTYYLRLITDKGVAVRKVVVLRR